MRQIVSEGGSFEKVFWNDLSVTCGTKFKAYFKSPWQSIHWSRQQKLAICFIHTTACEYDIRNDCFQMFICPFSNNSFSWPNFSLCYHDSTIICMHENKRTKMIKCAVSYHIRLRIPASRGQDHSGWKCMHFWLMTWWGIIKMISMIPKNISVFQVGISLLWIKI